MRSAEGDRGYVVLFFINSRLNARLAISSLAAMIIIVCSLLSGCGNNLSEKQYIDRAKELQDKGDYRSSVIELKNALRRNPNSMESRWMLGNIYIDIGDGAAAEKELRRAGELGVASAALTVPLGRALLLQEQFKRILQEIQPTTELARSDQAKVHAIRGYAQFGENHSEEAAKEFKVALLLNANLTMALLGNARLSLTEGDVDKARDWVNQAITADKNGGEAWSVLGDIDRYQDKLKEAEQAYTTAIAKRHNKKSDQLKRALVRIALGDMKGARDDIEALKKVVQNQPDVHYAEGLLLFQEKKYADAQLAFEETLRLVPDYMPAVFYLGASHYVQKHMGQAEQYLNQYLQYNPRYDIAAKLLGVVRLQNGDYKGVETALLPLLERNPKDTFALRLLGEAAMTQGHSKEGIAYLKKAVALAPDSAEMRARLGLGLLFKGEQDRGFHELELAIDIDPTLYQTETILIVNYLQAKAYDKALAGAQRMRERKSDSPVPLNLMGMAYVGLNQQDKARESFQQALKLSPGDPSAGINLASLEVKQGNLEKARSIYQDILKHHPGHLFTLLSLAEMETNAGKIEKARDLLQQAMDSNQNALQPRVLLARYYRNNGDPHKALILLQEVEKSYPNHPALLTEIGDAQLASGEPANALVTFKRLVEVLPKAAGSHYLLAKAYADMKNVDETRKEIKAALALEPNHVLARIAYIRLLLLEGKNDEAAEQLTQLKQKHPDEPEVFAEEGRLALAQNKPREAVSAYREAFKRSETTAILIGLAKSQWANGDQRVAIDTLENWLRKYPGDMQAVYVLGESYMALGRQGQAVDSFKQVVKRMPDNVLALNNLAWLLRKDDSKTAMKYAEHALELAPAAPAVMDTAAMVLLEQAQTERALRLLERASTKEPNNGEFHYHLAVALSKSGKTEEARKVLRELLGTKKHFQGEQEAQVLLKQLEAG